MKKKFKITVEGKTYEVEVEEIGGTGAPVKIQAPAVQPAAPAPVSEPKKASTTEGQQIPAPIPGKVWKITSKAGDKVKSGDVILILEAMKMENEISSPIDGEIKEILVSEGQSVNTGDALAVIG